MSKKWALIFSLLILLMIHPTTAQDSAETLIHDGLERTLSPVCTGQL